ncbi:MAG TPA: hypothetical protein VGM80_02320 [Gaiellaceae bacterium]|jgi:hypothetical protein
MSDGRTLDQVSRELDAQRRALAASIVAVRRDLRATAARQMPRAGFAAALVLGGLAARSFMRHRRASTAEVLRLGRFSITARD